MNENGESSTNNYLDSVHEGDNGQTVLGGHGTVPKTDARVVAHAECDAANAAVSVAMAGSELPTDINSILISVQNDLYDLVSDLSVPTTGAGNAAARIIPGHVERLERALEHYSAQASDLSGQILPGGTMAAALLYQARTAVRRCELAVWRALDEYPDIINPETARYLNRLSSLLFVLARGANAEHGDVAWVPESSVQTLLDGQEESGE